MVRKLSGNNIIGSMLARYSGSCGLNPHSRILIFPKNSYVFCDQGPIL